MNKDKICPECKNKMVVGRIHKGRIYYVCPECAALVELADPDFSYKGERPSNERL